MFKPLLSLQAQLMSVWHTPVTVARDFTEVCCYHWTNSYWWAFQAWNLRTPDPGSLPARSFWWFPMPGWLINLFRARLIWTCPPLFCVLVCLMWTLSCVAQTLPSHGIPKSLFWGSDAEDAYPGNCVHAWHPVSQEIRGRLCLASTSTEILREQRKKSWRKL